jgi:hypothetical protein
LLNPWRAAQRLELTTRQVRRLVARLREHGAAALVSGKRAKPSNDRVDAGMTVHALSKRAEITAAPGVAQFAHALSEPWRSSFCLSRR